MYLCTCNDVIYRLALPTFLYSNKQKYSIVVNSTVALCAVENLYLRFL